MEQARLAYARLRHRGDDLAVAGPGLFSRAAECRHLPLPSYEPRVTACSCQLQASPQRSQPGHFIETERFTDSLDLGRSERLKEEVALTQLSDLFGCGNRSDRRQRLHSRRDSS